LPRKRVKTLGKEGDEIGDGRKDQIGARPAVQRGRRVNRTWGDPASQLPERHAASDFDAPPGAAR